MCVFSSLALNFHCSGELQDQQIMFLRRPAFDVIGWNGAVDHCSMSCTLWGADVVQGSVRSGWQSVRYAQFKFYRATFWSNIFARHFQLTITKRNKQYIDKHIHYSGTCFRKWKLLNFLTPRWGKLGVFHSRMRGNLNSGSVSMVTDNVNLTCSLAVSLL